MKTWTQLTDIAKQDNLSLRRHASGVTVYTAVGLQLPLISITPGDLEDKDSDRVVRAALEMALRELKGLDP